MPRRIAQRVPAPSDSEEEGSEVASQKDNEASCSQAAEEEDDEEYEGQDSELSGTGSDAEEEEEEEEEPPPVTSEARTKRPSQKPLPPVAVAKKRNGSRAGEHSRCITCCVRNGAVQQGRAY